MEETFRELRSKRLQGMFVWLPMVASDSGAAADRQADRVADARILKYWDADRRLGRAVAQANGFPRRVAWDVYLVFAPGVRWKGERPPAPTFYMHQLELLDPALRLNGAAFIRKVKALLEDPGHSR